MSLYPGEVLLRNVAGAPCLFKYSPSASLAAKDSPLAVFVPGGAHLARIAYGGHDGYRREDFLAHWLNEQGFNFLAISYPLETESEAMPADHPGFRISNWGQQAAEVTKSVIEQHQLLPQVILASWSMGGRIVVPFTKASRELGVDVELYVALAATPGLQALPGGNPGKANILCTQKGYATSPFLLGVFLPQIEQQTRMNSCPDAIIPEEVFKRDYFGHTPVSMLGWLLKYDGNGFVDDEGLSIQDAAATEFASFPWIATLYPDSELDPRHALADRATWNFVFTLKLTGQVELARRLGKKPITGSVWQSVSALVDAIPSKLATGVEGNHYFFLGEKGARSTASLISKHWETYKELHAQFRQLLDD